MSTTFSRAREVAPLLSTTWPLRVSVARYEKRPVTVPAIRDPRTGRLAPLYNPRLADWMDHFAFTKHWRLRGRSPVGRATIETLGMNRAAIIAIRTELVQLGRYPPYVE